MAEEERIVILAKKEWEEFLAGHCKTLTIYTERDLHHVFGDDPEPEIVRVKLSLIK